MNINATVADLKQNVRKLHRWTQYFRLAITGDIIFENCSENEIEKQLRSQDVS